MSRPAPRVQRSRMQDTRPPRPASPDTGGRLRSVRRSAWRIAGRARDVFPPTARGVSVAALSALALWLYGYGALDLVLFAIGMAGLVVVSLCTVAVGLGALVLARRLRPHEALPIRVEAARPLPT